MLKGKKTEETKGRGVEKHVEFKLLKSALGPTYTHGINPVYYRVKRDDGDEDIFYNWNHALWELLQNSVNGNARLKVLNMKYQKGLVQCKELDLPPEGADVHTAALALYQRPDLVEALQKHVLDIRIIPTSL